MYLAHRGESHEKWSRVTSECRLPVSVVQMQTGRWCIVHCADPWRTVAAGAIDAIGIGRDMRGQRTLHTQLHLAKSRILTNHFGPDISRVATIEGQLTQRSKPVDVLRHILDIVGSIADRTVTRQEHGLTLALLQVTDGGLHTARPGTEGIVAGRHRLRVKEVTDEEMRLNGDRIAREQ